MKISTIILAAGESSRLGQPKQLLKYENQTLIERIVSIVSAMNFEKNIVVLGAFANEIKSVLTADKVEIIMNEDWKKGMSSSLQKGLEVAENSDAVLVLLSDQPFINAALINEIIEKAKNTNFPIIATKYKEVLGVPTLFKQSIFEELKSLNASVGAKKIIKQYAQNNQVDFVDFEKAAIDIDTMADYERLLEMLK